MSQFWRQINIFILRWGIRKFTKENKATEKTHNFKFENDKVMAAAIVQTYRSDAEHSQNVKYN